jgi:Flp pilus assembly protein TadG
MRTSQKGNAILEFALAFPMLFAIFAGCYQFGYAFYVYNEMQTAVRSGARYAARQVYDSATATPSSAYTTAVRNMVVYGNPAGGTQPVVPGLTTQNVSVSMAFELGVPREVNVKVTSYQASAAVAMLRFNSKPSVSMPFVGGFDPS